MSVLDAQVRAFLESVPVGVLTTLRPDGRARQSVVYFVLDGDRVLTSTEVGRHKCRDVEREGWASLCVVGPHPPYPSLTLEGAAYIRTTEIGPATAAVLTRILGQPPEEVPDDDDLAQVGRVVFELHVERCYGRSHLPEVQSPSGEDTPAGG